MIIEDSFAEQLYYILPSHSLLVKPLGVDDSRFGAILIYYVLVSNRPIY